MKKENSQLFTEDLTKYSAFLSATNEGLVRAIDDMKQQVEARKRILKIVEKQQNGQAVSIRDIAALAKKSCPDFHSLDTLIDLIDKLGIDPPAAFINESQYRRSLDCSGKTCTECWRSYINNTARILNESPIDIKNYDLDGDDI